MNSIALPPSLSALSDSQRLEIGKLLPEDFDELDVILALQLLEFKEDSNIDNGQTLATENAGNPYHDELGRFSTGGGGTGTADPSHVQGDAVMSHTDAKGAIKGSKVQYPVYHGTAGDYGDNIAQNGFKYDPKGGNMYGNGIYLTKDVGAAYMYGAGRDNKEPTTVSAFIDAKKFYSAKAGHEPVYKLVGQEMVKRGYWSHPNQGGTSFEDFRKYNKTYKDTVNSLLHQYDAVEIPADDQQTGMIVVKDPSKIKIFRVDKTRSTVDTVLKREIGV